MTAQKQYKVIDPSSNTFGAKSERVKLVIDGQLQWRSVQQIERSCGERIEIARQYGEVLRLLNQAEIQSKQLCAQAQALAPEMWPYILFRQGNMHYHLA